MRTNKSKIGFYCSFDDKNAENHIISNVKELQEYCLDKNNYYTEKPDNITFNKLFIDGEDIGIVFGFTHRGFASELAIDFIELGRSYKGVYFFKKELMETAEKLMYFYRQKKEKNND
jgi:hypothetical protein